ncbi:F0F1 ATP synthase subunit B' [Hansschlegelia beijingensis]|uniref:F0F1 ATP synthase subunit B family protein n=1 Tax=Hansschlegelia beijingensis TaxID=1133344 RepID=UPI003825C294
MTETVGQSGHTIVLAQQTHDGATPTFAGTETAGSHGAGHDPAFPPFDAGTFPGQLLWLAIFFGLLLWLMKSVALPRVSNILEGRADRIASDLAEANRLKNETDAAIESYEKALAAARAEAGRIAGEMHERIARDAEEKRQQLEAELNAKLADADRQIAESKTSALSNVRGIAVEAGAAIVERLTGKAPAQPEIEQAVDASLAA